MIKMTKVLAILGLASCVLSFSGNAAELPLWELGAGVGVVSMQDYRGSDQRQTYVLPIPYVVYRGDVIQVDREKIRGLLYKSDRMELDVSLNGSIPVKSENNAARQGMPNLDPTLEIGPQLNVFLSGNAKSDYALTLRLPVRSVQAMDGLQAQNAGLIFSPVLNLDLKPGNGWNVGLSGGPIFADKQYHEYFYSVDAQYAKPDRPAYEAHGGYSGTQFIASMSKRYPHFWLGAFVRADSLQGAAFEDSPLLKQKYAVSGGFGISWVFAQSKVRVSATD